MASYYFVKRTETMKGTGDKETWYIGKQDMYFDENENLSSYLIQKYGFCNAAAAKRTGAFKSRGENNWISGATTSIVKFTITEDWKILMEEETEAK